MVSIYISRKNIPCHTIVGLCPPISTSGPSKNGSISAGSGFAGPTLPYPSISFWGGGGFLFIVNFNSNSNSNPNSNSKSNSNSNSNSNSMIPYSPKIARTFLLESLSPKYSHIKNIRSPLSLSESASMIRYFSALLFSRSRFNSKRGVKKKGTKPLHFWSKIHSGNAYSVFGVKCTPISFTLLLG